MIESIEFIRYENNHHPFSLMQSGGQKFYHHPKKSISSVNYEPFGHFSEEKEDAAPSQPASNQYTFSVPLDPEILL